MPRSNKGDKCILVGVDLAPIKAIPGCETFQSDITTPQCRATLRDKLKHFKADTVLHDGAPNVGTAWVQDAFSQAELVLQSLKLATEFLKEGGTFVTKVFRSKDYNSLLWVFNQLFVKVEATKPPSSRNVSAEIFVVCRGFKAPKKMDMRFLDPRAVFAELSDPTPNNEAKVFNPEKKKRKREGYEEGDWTQFKEVPASDFIHTTDPIKMLGELNRFSFDQKGNGDIALATLDKLPETTTEIRDCCADLKVLGRKEFKLLLRWRLKVREIFGFSAKQKQERENAQNDEEVAEVESMDEEMKIQEEMQRLRDQDSKQKKKERRRDNERKQKEVMRMQMNMTTPMDLGMEQGGPTGEDTMFALRQVDKAGALSKIAKGRMTQIHHEPEISEESEVEDLESDEEEDRLEWQLDNMYEQFVERKSEADAKYRAKRARRERDDGEWNGFSEDEKAENSDNGDAEDDVYASSSDDEEDGVKLLTDLDYTESKVGGLSKRAAAFFDQDIFKDIEGLEPDVGDEVGDRDSGIDVDDSPERTVPSKSTLKKESNRTETVQPSADTPSTSGGSFETVPRDENHWEADSIPMKDGRPDIDIITAEAMTLAHSLASGKLTKADLLDAGFNKYSLRDVDGLPEWFLDDENKHSRPQRPITKAAAAAIKEKLRALNARPIKKVREAKDRKKFKAAQRLEKMRKKSATLIEDEGMTEGDKAKAVSKMMAKAVKKKPKAQVKVVVAKHGNRGVQGRPRGTKGKYKMVDSRMKKDVRAEKRLKKKAGR